MSIFPGSVVKNSNGRQSRLGPLVYSEGNWYGFVPTHSILKDGKVFEAGTDLLVAEVVSMPDPVLVTSMPADSNFLPITEALRLVKFFPYAPVSAKSLSETKLAEPIDCLSDTCVFVKSDAMASKVATIVFIDSPFAIEAHDGVKTYIGAFGIVSEEKDVRIGEEGDGGSSITTDKGELVGVLIGIVEDDFGFGPEFYCAPARELFARYFPGFDQLNVFI